MHGLAPGTCKCPRRATGRVAHASSGLSSLSVYIYCLEQPAMVGTPRMALAGRSFGSAPSTTTLRGCNGNDAVVSRASADLVTPLRCYGVPDVASPHCELRAKKWAVRISRTAHITFDCARGSLDPLTLNLIGLRHIGLGLLG